MLSLPPLMRVLSFFYLTEILIVFVLPSASVATAIYMPCGNPVVESLWSIASATIIPVIPIILSRVVSPLVVYTSNPLYRNSMADISEFMVSVEVVDDMAVYLAIPCLGMRAHKCILLPSLFAMAVVTNVELETPAAPSEA